MYVQCLLVAVLTPTRQCSGVAMSSLRTAGCRKIPDLDTDSKYENTNQPESRPEAEVQEFGV